MSAPHAAWMARALFLAERGRGRTTPNPLVGAVVVNAEGVVVGQGAHLLAGGPHAEVAALAAAGDAARGSTLYCTLEPCCHTGRTGPCTDLILEAGITRVVTAIDDPNPLVSGGGHTRLRAAGVEVITGIGDDEARRQNAPFLTWITRHRPWTLLKTAVSADGYVGPHGGQGRAYGGQGRAYGGQGLQPLAQSRGLKPPGSVHPPPPGSVLTRLTGPATDRWMHRQRAWIDAIAVGADTVLADDPQLTARGAWRPRPLTRVVIDWRGRVPPTARVYSTVSAGPVIMVGLDSVSPGHVASLRNVGVDVVLLSTRDLAAVGHALGRREVQSLLVEGGPVLQQAWVDAGLVDAVQYVRTPVRLGSGVPAAPALVAWADTAHAAHRTTLGADTLVEGMWS